MRLRRFDLTRYGRFTDYSIDFGAQRPGVPDFHIVYGANEAGKSTVRNAFLDFLFGIEKQSAYNFLHPYASMRIGGLVEAAQGAHELVRVKKDRTDLLDADERPIAEDFFSSLLGAIDRSGYETMFSLDDDSLQAGGESILKSEGDLGRLLFSAASGLSELGDVVDAVKTEASEFYRPRGRGHDLAKAKVRLKALKDRIAEIDVLAKDYSVLAGKAATARDLYRHGVEEQDAARQAFERIRKITDALPLWRDLIAKRLEFEPLARLPDLPEGWLAEAQDLSRSEAAALAHRNGLQSRADAVGLELEDLVPDAEILEIEADFDRLKRQGLEARYISAEDIAARQRDLANVERDLAGLLQRLGRDPASEPSEALLPALTVGVLNDLLERRPALVTARDTAVEEVETARARAEAASNLLAACGAPGGGQGENQALASLVMKVREAAHDREVAALVRQRDQAVRDLDGALRALAPWTGDAERLARLAVPDPQKIADWKQAVAALRTEAADLDREIADRRADHDRLSADIAARSPGTADFDDDADQRARDARDAAWALHRARIAQSGEPAGAVDVDGLAASADLFETSMGAHDHLSTARFERASELVTMRQARADLVRCEAAIDALQRKRDDLAIRLEGVSADIRTCMGSLLLPEDTQVDFCEAWLERRTAALARCEALAGIERDLSLAEAARGEAARRLCESLAAGPDVDPEKPLDHLIAVAQAHVDRLKQAEADTKAARRSVDDANRDLADRKRALDRAAQKLQAWTKAWDEALEDTWLARPGGNRAPAGMREILACLTEVSSKLERRDELKHRIVAMAEDRRAFEAAVEALAERAGAAFAAADTLTIADALETRLTEARRVKARLEEKQEELGKAREDLRRADAALDALKARYDAMAGLFPSDGFTALVRNLERARDKARLRETIAGKERDLIAILEVATIADAEILMREVADEEPALAEMSAERARAEQVLANLDNHVRGLFHEWKSAETALASVDGDATVARLEEERQTLLLDIEARAQRYLGFSVGAMVADHALRAYRDRHRNSMMRRAASAFATITRGGFRDLITTPGKNSEILVGVRADGGSLEASMMSKGTRFQLYLALRIAGYAEFAERRTALPFFADDIMETFDDDRSAETFQLLGDMARTGQVIYLTHHRHLCAIARKVAGDGVRVHALPDPDQSFSGAE